MTDLPPPEAPVPIPLPGIDYDALARRLGEANLRKRLEHEQGLNRDVVKGRKGWRLRKQVNLTVIARWTLMLTGLFDRGRRNLLQFSVERRDLFLPRLPEAFDGARILHLTDIHADCHPDLMPALISRVKGLAGEFDICLNTGDFRNHDLGGFQTSTEMTRQLCEAIATQHVAVLGNHDFIEVVPELEQAGMRVLLNESIPWRREGEQVWLVGVDDSSRYNTDDFDRAMPDIPTGDCIILLSHGPDVFREAAQRGCDLQLSGHCHGGQIALPGGMPLVTRSFAPNRVCVGTWQQGSMLGHTSRGVGGTLPVRFFCPPEIGLFTLRRGPLEQNLFGKRPFRRSD
ncbi:MAG: metallophosphoesterase [Opitutales bacterium]